MKFLYEVILVFSLPILLFAQTENWVYTYDGPESALDKATSIAYGADGNIYAAGYVGVSFANDDLIAISLTTDGDTNWIHQYDGPGSGNDVANSIVSGLDSNLYVAGYSYSSSSDLFVMSFATDGDTNWTFRYDGPMYSADYAREMVYGSDGNLYVAGAATFSGYDCDLAVMSLTNRGDSNWLYLFDGPGGVDDDEAYDVVQGLDGNIYAAGASGPGFLSYDFLVISITPDGNTNWAYKKNGTANGWDHAQSIAYGMDGNIYAAGFIENSGNGQDFTVISLDSTGTERWIYMYDGPNNSGDQAYSIIYGSDKNIYAAGCSQGIGSQYDFTVISLTTEGDTNWVYRYNGTGNFVDKAFSIIEGDDGNLYAAGFSNGLSTYGDFTVISLDTTGSENWVYTYNGTGNNGDQTNSLIYGDDGNIYAAGQSNGFGTYYDFTVISLMAVGVEENHILNPSVPSMNLEVFPNPFRNYTDIRYQITDDKLQITENSVELKIYDITGKLIKSFDDLTNQPFNQVEWDGRDNSGAEIPNGIYFLKLDVVSTEETGEPSKTKKLLFLK